MSLPGLLIGIPSSGRPVDIRWAFSLQVMGINAPVGSFTTWMVEIGPDRAGNRETLAQKALDCGARYLFMLDDDTVPPHTVLKDLTYEIEKDPSIMVAGGIYCTKEPQPRPLVFKRIGDGAFWNWKLGDVFDCEGIGTGCMLIKTEVFSHLPKPWFFEPHETPVDETREVNGRQIPVMHRSGTDDLYFCQKVIAAGFRIIAHGGALCAHIGQNGVIYGIPEDSYPMRKSNALSIEKTAAGNGDCGTLAGEAVLA